MLSTFGIAFLHYDLDFYQVGYYEIFFFKTISGYPLWMSQHLAIKLKKSIKIIFARGLFREEKISKFLEVYRSDPEVAKWRDPCDGDK